MKKNSSIVKLLLVLTTIIFLNGCSDLVLLNPQGAVGNSEKILIITTVALMLIVVIPAILMTIWFAWKFRDSNKSAKYLPEWSSHKVEVGIWIIPAIITFIIAGITWYASHALDPYKPLQSNTKPLNIQVVSMDWKWLFIYPDQQIATINELVIPTGTPVHFFITSDKIMNSFFIPQLGSQIMSMPGMQTQLYLIADHNGHYQGISANFSGPGFSRMHFSVTATSADQFQKWVSLVKQSTKKIDYPTYQLLAKPSSNNPVEYFSTVQPNLYKNIINQYMQM